MQGAIGQGRAVQGRAVQCRAGQGMAVQGAEVRKGTKRIHAQTSGGRYGGMAASDFGLKSHTCFLASTKAPVLPGHEGDIWRAAPLGDVCINAQSQHSYISITKYIQTSGFMPRRRMSVVLVCYRFLCSTDSCCLVLLLSR